MYYFVTINQWNQYINFCQGPLTKIWYTDLIGWNSVERFYDKHMSNLTNSVTIATDTLQHNDKMVTKQRFLR